MLEFDRPIAVPGAEPLKTLADARKFILALPDDQHDSGAAQAAAQALLMAANKTGPVLHAQCGMIQLIHGKHDGTIQQAPKFKIGRRLNAR